MQHILKDSLSLEQKFQSEDMDLLRTRDELKQLLGQFGYHYKLQKFDSLWRKAVSFEDATE